MYHSGRENEVGAPREPRCPGGTLSHTSELSNGRKTPQNIQAALDRLSAPQLGLKREYRGMHGPCTQSQNVAVGAEGRQGNHTAA